MPQDAVATQMVSESQVSAEMATEVTQPPLPVTSFTCADKVQGGYYADVEVDCQLFHICSQGRHGRIKDNKFLCGPGTRFNQQSRTCQARDLVDCKLSSSLYHLNNHFSVPVEDEVLPQEASFEPHKVQRKKRSIEATRPAENTNKRNSMSSRRRRRQSIVQRYQPTAEDFYYDDEAYYDDYSDGNSSHYGNVPQKNSKELANYDDYYFQDYIDKTTTDSQDPSLHENVRTVNLPITTQKYTFNSNRPENHTSDADYYLETDYVNDHDNPATYDDRIASNEIQNSTPVVEKTTLGEDYYLSHDYVNDNGEPATYDEHVGKNKTKDSQEVLIEKTIVGVDNSTTNKHVKGNVVTTTHDKVSKNKTSTEDETKYTTPLGEDYYLSNEYINDNYEPSTYNETVEKNETRTPIVNMTNKQEDITLSKNVIKTKSNNGTNVKQDEGFGSIIGTLNDLRTLIIDPIINGSRDEYEDYYYYDDDVVSVPGEKVTKDNKSESIKANSTEVPVTSTTNKPRIKGQDIADFEKIEGDYSLGDVEKKDNFDLSDLKTIDVSKIFITTDKPPPGESVDDIINYTDVDIISTIGPLDEEGKMPSDTNLDINRALEVKDDNSTSVSNDVKNVVTVQSGVVSPFSQEITVAMTTSLPAVATIVEDSQTTSITEAMTTTVETIITTTTSQPSTTTTTTIKPKRKFDRNRYRTTNSPVSTTTYPSTIQSLYQRTKSRQSFRSRYSTPTPPMVQIIPLSTIITRRPPIRSRGRARFNEIKQKNAEKEASKKQNQTEEWENYPVQFRARNLEDSDTAKSSVHSNRVPSSEEYTSVESSTTPIVLDSTTGKLSSESTTLPSSSEGYEDVSTSLSSIVTPDSPKETTQQLPVVNDELEESSKSTPVPTTFAAVKDSISEESSTLEIESTDFTPTLKAIPLDQDPSLKILQSYAQLQDVKFYSEDSEVTTDVAESTTREPVTTERDVTTEPHRKIDRPRVSLMRDIVGSRRQPPTRVRGQSSRDPEGSAGKPGRTKGRRRRPMAEREGVVRDDPRYNERPIEEDVSSQRRHFSPTHKAHTQDDHLRPHERPEEEEYVTTQYRHFSPAHKPHAHNNHLRPHERPEEEEDVTTQRTHFSSKHNVQEEKDPLRSNERQEENVSTHHKHFSPTHKAQAQNDHLRSNKRPETENVTTQSRHFSPKHEVHAPKDHLRSNNRPVEEEVTIQPKYFSPTHKAQAQNDHLISNERPEEEDLSTKSKHSSTKHEVQEHNAPVRSSNRPKIFSQEDSFSTKDKPGDHQRSDKNSEAHSEEDDSSQQRNISTNGEVHTTRAPQKSDATPRVHSDQVNSQGRHISTTDRTQPHKDPQRSIPQPEVLLVKDLTHSHKLAILQDRGEEHAFFCTDREMYMYYADPVDRKLFHYCSPGFHSRQKLDFRFVCDRDTTFNPALQRCE